MGFTLLNKTNSKQVKDKAIASSLISSKLTSITKRKNNVHRRLYNHIKSSIERKRLELSDLANISPFNSDFKKKLLVRINAQIIIIMIKAKIMKML